MLYLKFQIEIHLNNQSERSVVTHSTGRMAEGFDDQDQERFIISGVIDGVKQSFVDSGVDVEVLAKLEDLWLSKLRASSSHGLAIADVLEPPAAKRVKGKGKGKNRVPVIPKEEPVLEEEEEEAGERSKSDVIVISSDDSQEQELVNKPQTTVSLHSFI